MTFRDTTSQTPPISAVEIAVLQNFRHFYNQDFHKISLNVQMQNNSGCDNSIGWIYFLGRPPRYLNSLPFSDDVINGFSSMLNLIFSIPPLQRNSSSWINQGPVGLLSCRCLRLNQNINSAVLRSPSRRLVGS